MGRRLRRKGEQPPLFHSEYLHLGKIKARDRMVRANVLKVLGDPYGIRTRVAAVKEWIYG